MATGDILSARIERPGAAINYPNLDGWVLSFIIEGWGGKTVSSIDLGWTAPNDSIGNDPDTDTPNVTVSLSRAGFQVSGTTVSTTTRTRTLYGTRRIRQVYPLNTSFLTDVVGGDLRVYVGLSGHVYASDSSITVNIASGTVTAADASTSNAASGLSVANNSALIQPKVKGTVLNRAGSLPYTRITGNYQQAVHGDCDSGILGALFTLSDESANTVNEFVSEPTVVECERTASGTLPKGFGWVSNTDITGLNQGEVMTARFRIYPIDGDASSVFDSDDNTSAGDPWHIRSYKHRIDHAGTWPTVYAYVDTANGNNGTGVASTTAATAQASPFAHQWDAIKAARDFINTNYSRANSLDGVVIRLMDNAGSAQDFEWGRTGFAATMTALGAAPIFEPDPDNAARVRYRTPNATLSNRDIRCANAIIRVPVEPASANQTNFFAGFTSDDLYVFDRGDLVSESTSGSAVLIASNLTRALFYCNKTEDWYADPFRVGSVFWPEFVGWERASGYANESRAYVGWKLRDGDNAWTVSTDPTLFSNSVEMADARFLFQDIYKNTNSIFSQAAKLTNNLIASCSWVLDPTSGSQPNCLFADQPIEDCLWRDMSALGQRTNLHNEGTNITHDRAIFDSCAFAYFSTKHDVFSEDGTDIDGWETAWGVSFRNIYNGDNDTFPFEFEGLHVYSKPNPVLEADRDPATVNGLNDVTPTAASELSGLIRAGTVPSKRFDLNGVEVPNDGTGSAGAYQEVPPVGGGGGNATKGNFGIHTGIKIGV